MAEGMVDFLWMVRGCECFLLPFIFLGCWLAGWLCPFVKRVHNLAYARAVTGVSVGHIVATQAMSSFETSAFRGLSTPEHVEGCKRLALSRGGAKGSADGKRILSETFEGFEASLGNLAPLCGSVIEVEYLAGLKQVAALFRTESDDGESLSPFHLPAYLPSFPITPP